MRTELPLVLIGPMAAGKTSVGCALAEQLHYAFFDSDEWIEETTGSSINSLFSQLGESGFRQIEADCIKKLLKPNNNRKQVIATGGGVLSSPELIDYLQMHSVVILLLLEPEEQWRRIQLEQHSGQNTRPLANSLDQLRILYNARLSDYLRCSDLIINAAEVKTPDELAKKIIKIINK